jgi:hypothetical protein
LTAADETSALAAFATGHTGSGWTILNAGFTLVANVFIVSP